MCTKRGFLLGFESGLTEAALPIVSTDGIVSSGTPRKNDAATRGGAFNWEANSSSSNVRTVVTRVANGIAWEEYIVEAGISRPGSSLSSFVFIAKDSIGVNRGLTVEMTNAGEIKHYVGGSGSNAGQGTLQGTSAGSALTPSDEYVFISSHIRIASGTDGFMTTFVEDQLQLDTSGIDTVGNTVTALFDSVIGASVFGKMDDIFIRPRCVLIDAGSAITGTPTLGGTVLEAAGASADVYAWESNTTDSNAGSGDPELPADTFRLYLRNVSFAPQSSSGGWADNATVTVTGLSGPTLSVFAPHAGFANGLEPGGQYLTRALFIERMIPDSNGTDNTDGTLAGGATSRFDALAVVDDAKCVEHTVAGDVVSVGLTTLANQTTINRIAGLRAYTRASSDGADPNSLQMSIYDNGAAIDKTEKQLVFAAQTVITNNFDSNAAGGEWAPGAGAGGIDDLQGRYTTSTL